MCVNKIQPRTLAYWNQPRHSLVQRTSLAQDPLLSTITNQVQRRTQTMRTTKISCVNNELGHTYGEKILLSKLKTLEVCIC